jgi:hypothetical protein
MSSEPAPVVVGTTRASPPRLIWAYGKYKIGGPARSVSAPAQKGRVQRQRRNLRRAETKPMCRSTQVFVWLRCFRNTRYRF